MTLATKNALVLHLSNFVNQKKELFSNKKRETHKSVFLFFIFSFFISVIMPTFGGNLLTYQRLLRFPPHKLPKSAIGSNIGHTAAKYKPINTPAVFFKVFTSFFVINPPHLPLRENRQFRVYTVNSYICMIQLEKIYLHINPSFSLLFSSIF